MPVHRHRLTSRVLEGNPPGDPVARDLYVYVPPDHDPALAGGARGVGFTGTGGVLCNVGAPIEPLRSRLDRMIGSGANHSSRRNTTRQLSPSSVRWRAVRGRAASRASRLSGCYWQWWAYTRS